MSGDRRYVFCAVSLDDGPEDYRRIGLGGTTATLVCEGGLGALVQAQESTVETEAADDIQRLLVDHLAIVDEVGDTFGTPLPLRFNTMFEGGDEAVRTWLRTEHEAIATQLDTLAGHWEYRITVSWTDDRPAEAATDDRLEALDGEIEAAPPGKRFLLEKQYERQVAELARERKAAEQDALEARVRPHAKAVEALEDQSVQFGDRDETGEVVARISVLASERGASRIGDELDEVAAEDGVEVRYTGPWPPYTHVSGGVPE